MKIQGMKAEHRIQKMQKMIRARTERGLTVSEKSRKMVCN